MNIKKALKEKNKLVKQVGENFTRLAQYNSVEEGSIRPYNPRTSLDELMSTIDGLVELKTKIHLANAPVYQKIFKLAELKSIAAKLKNLSCEEGKRSGRGIYGSQQEPVIMTAVISVVERDELIKNIESEIERIQDELDAHNATTTI